MESVAAPRGLFFHIILAILLIGAVAGAIGATFIPSYFGLPLYFYVGAVLGILIPLQVAIAKRWLKVDFKWHRRNGLVIFYVGLIHATLAIGAYVFHVKVQGF